MKYWVWPAELGCEAFFVVVALVLSSEIIARMSQRLTPCMNIEREGVGMGVE